jgi:uncharacterized protein YceK
MLRNINHKWAVIAVSSILLLNGCSTTSIMQTKRETAKNVKYASDISKEMQNPNASNIISFSDTPFLSTKTFSQSEVIKPLPPVFSKTLSINTHQNKTLPAYIQTIESMTGLSIKLTQDAQDELNGLSDNGANKKKCIPSICFIKQARDGKSYQWRTTK